MNEKETEPRVGSCCGHEEHDGHGAGDVGAVVADAVERLRAAGMRVTGQRKAMLRFLAEAPAPVSVEEIHKALAADTASENAGADLVTVYRSIEAFEGVGVVRRHPLESGKNLWCLERGGHAHHHHIICRECGHADELDGCDVARFETTAKKLGYSELSHVFEIYGVCRNCAGSRTATPHR